MTAINDNTEQPSQKSIDEQLDTLQKQLIHYLELNAKAGAESNEYDTKFEEISKKVEALQKQKNELTGKERLRASYKQRVDEITKYFDNTSEIR